MRENKNQHPRYKRDQAGKFARKDNAKYHKGYLVVYQPDHPHARENGYVYDHILKMEERIGRYLLPGEVVHHIDGDKLNNSSDNLQLFPSNSEHLRAHWVQRSPKFELSDGRMLTITEMAEESGLPYTTITQRIKKLGWSPDKAISVEYRGKIKPKRGDCLA